MASGFVGILAVELHFPDSGSLKGKRAVLEARGEIWTVPAEEGVFPNVEVPDEAVAFRADYDLGFARVMLACYLNKRLLVVDAYTVFQDGSGRSPYFQRDHFYIP